MSRPSCLAEADLLSAATGESMTAAARAHLARCPSCGRRLRRLQGEVAVLRHVVAGMEWPSSIPLAPPDNAG